MIILSIIYEAVDMSNVGLARCISKVLSEVSIRFVKECMLLLVLYMNKSVEYSVCPPIYATYHV